MGKKEKVAKMVKRWTRWEKSLYKAARKDVARVRICSISYSGRMRKEIAGQHLKDRYPEPFILVLDEPTTGLDSSTAYQCIKILHGLTECKINPPVILATLLQPSAKILMQFDLIYLLSKNGHCLYFGQTDQIKSYFIDPGVSTR